MSAFATKLLPTIKTTLRRTDTEFDEEIKSYIDTCALDLQRAGVLSSYFADVVVSDVSWECDCQILQAVRWYCLGNFGLYNADMEKYQKAYASLKSTICTQSVYTEVLSV